MLCSPFLFSLADRLRLTIADRSTPRPHPTALCFAAASSLPASVPHLSPSPSTNTDRVSLPRSRFLGIAASPQELLSSSLAWSDPAPYSSTWTTISSIIFFFELFVEFRNEKACNMAEGTGWCTVGPSFVRGLAAVCFHRCQAPEAHPFNICSHQFFQTQETPLPVTPGCPRPGAVSTSL